MVAPRGSQSGAREDATPPASIGAGAGAGWAGGIRLMGPGAARAGDVTDHTTARVMNVKNARSSGRIPIERP